MKVAIIGTGYVGLPTGVGLASLGHQVTCVDCIPEKIEKLRAGQVTLFEEGLEDLLLSGLKSGNLRFTTSIAEGVSDAQLVMVAVGTPENPETGETNPEYLFAAVEELAKCLKSPTVVAIKSTVPVDTGDRVEELIREANPAAQAEVISLPEFLREGYAVHDFFHPARIMVGTESESARALIRELYAPMQPAPEFLFVKRRSAEAIKYAADSFPAVKSRFIDEMADFCEAVGANIHEVAQGMGLDDRFEPEFLKSGPGFGGSYLEKDTKALLRMAQSHGVELPLVQATITGDERRRRHIAQKILDAVKDIPHPRIAVWGLAPKNGTDDCRESPAINVVQHLTKRGNVTVVVYDPQTMDTTHKILGNSVTYAPDKKSAVRGAHVLTILVERSEFAEADMRKVQDLMDAPAKIIDCRFPAHTDILTWIRQ